MSRHPFRAAVVLLAGALCIASAAAEDVYKWTDSKGVTHYADAPPAGMKYEKLSVGKGTATAEDESADTPEEEAANAAAALAAANAKASSPSCLQARANMEVLQGNLVIRKDVDGDGVPEDVSGAQREKEMENAQKLIDVYCGTQVGG
jgi:hypothetical protein